MTATISVTILTRSLWNNPRKYELETEDLPKFFSPSMKIWLFCLYYTMQRNWKQTFNASRFIFKFQNLWVEICWVIRKHNTDLRLSKANYCWRVQTLTIRSKCTLSLPPENIRKPCGVLMFLEKGCIENKWIKQKYNNTQKKYAKELVCLYSWDYMSNHDENKDENEK